MNKHYNVAILNSDGEIVQFNAVTYTDPELARASKRTWENYLSRNPGYGCRAVIMVTETTTTILEER